MQPQSTGEENEACTSGLDERPTGVGGLPMLSEQDWREMMLRLAHEIRNPLATIKSSAQLVQRLSTPEGDMVEFLQRILVNVDRIDSTLRDLQRFVRTDEGNPTAVDLAAAVEDAAAQQRARARNSGIHVTVAGGPPARALIDPTNLRMAVEELLKNAISVTPAGGCVMVSWLSDGHKVVVHVDDEGPGIGPDLADRILRPFFSAANHGTGLGLNLVDRVCRLAGGSLAWRNLAGKGCRFSVFLPAA